MTKKKNKFFKWFTKKFQLFLYHGKSYNVIWKLRFNRLVFILTLLFSITLLFFASYALISHTRIKETIPDFPTVETKTLIYENTIRTDSLIEEIYKRDLYLKMLRDLILDEIPIDQNYVVPIQHLSEQQIKNFNNPSKPREDGKTLIEQSRIETAKQQVVEQQIKDTNKLLEDNKKDVFFTEQNNVDTIHELAEEEIKNFNYLPVSRKKDNNTPEYSEYLEDIIPTLFPPIKGRIVSSFDKTKEHFGTDIASTGETSIFATLSGTVLFADYTMQTGYTIMIQHKNELISVYKHNKSILITQGQHVKTGQVIAIYGNTGEYTSGAHLHFELWKKGKALNPEDYIDFK